MADPSRYRGPAGDTGVSSERRSNTSVPRWVKVFVIVAVVLVLLFVVLQVVGGGGHGPGRHAGNAGDRAPLVQSS